MPNAFLREGEDGLLPPALGGRRHSECFSSRLPSFFACGSSDSALNIQGGDFPNAPILPNRARRTAFRLAPIQSRHAPPCNSSGGADALPDAHNKVALLTCNAFPGLYEDDLLLLNALTDIGIEAVPAVWSDAVIDWNAFGAIVIRSPWDYFEHVAEFRAWLAARAADRVPLCNPLETLVWNFDKGYLQDLAHAGVAIVPTICIPPGESADIAALAQARGWSDIVVKPTVSGGAYRCDRFRVEDIALDAPNIARTLEDRGILVQPFFPEILSEGELSLLFFDGVFSHAVRKRPKAGDYRVQFQYGGTNENEQVDADLIAQAQKCIANAPTPTVYARVDGVVSGGRFLLMELEVFEPLMFLSRHPEAPVRFARAIEKWLLSLRG